MNIKSLLKPNVAKKLPACVDVFTNGGGIILVRLSSGSEIAIEDVMEIVDGSKGLS